MELGALVCHSAAPRCGGCPVREMCAARLSGDPTLFPQFEGVKKWLDVEDVSVAVRNTAREVLIVQRPTHLPLWGGLWELPRATRQEGESLSQCAARAVCESIGLAVTSPTLFGVVKHGVANRRITLHGFEAQAAGQGQPEALGCARFAWEPLENLQRYALATPQVRLTGLLGMSDAQGRLDLSE